MKITNAALTSFAVAVGFADTATRIQFSTLVGNLPWSSWSKFATPSSPAGGEFGGLPTASLPSAGAITIYEVGVGTEVMYYGSITWTAATTGYFNNVKRASTAYTFTAAATGSYTNVIPVRTKMSIWNRTGSPVYVADSAAINGTPTNSIKIPWQAVLLNSTGVWSAWVEPLQEVWVYPTSNKPGVINIVEYR